MLNFDKSKICNILVCRKQRFVYAVRFVTETKITGVVKFDLSIEPKDDEKMKLDVGGNVAGIFDLGPGRFGSEAVFVPREPGVSSDEDDGYLIFFVHDENTGYLSLSLYAPSRLPSLPLYLSIY